MILDVLANSCQAHAALQVDATQHVCMQGETGLHVAAKGGKISVAEFLITKDVAIDARSNQVGLDLRLGQQMHCFVEHAYTQSALCASIDQ